MRISDLARRGGLPLPTVRYYLRAGLLPHGVATAANQAEYDDRHLHRLRLLAVLLDVGGLPVARARAVLTAMDDRRVPLGDLLALTTTDQPRASVRGPAPEQDAVRRRVAGVLTAHGIATGPGARPLERLTGAYAAAGHLDLPELEAALGRYADAAAGFAAQDTAVLAAAAGRTGAAGVREAAVVVAVLSGVVQETLCELARQQALPGVRAPRPPS